MMKMCIKYINQINFAREIFIFNSTVNFYIKVAFVLFHINDFKKILLI